MVSKFINKINLKFSLLFGIVLLVAILTPHLIRGHVLVSEKYAQSIILFLDVALAYVFYLIYRRDIKKIKKDKEKVEKNLTDSYEYIGQVNNKMELMNSFVNSLSVNGQGEEKPISKKDILNSLLRDMVVSVAKSNKGLLRFINPQNKRTINEFYYHKEGDLFRPRLSNWAILEGVNDNEDDELSILESDYKNVGTISVFCYYKNGQEEVDGKLLKTLLNQVHLLFMVMHCKHFG